MDFGGKGRKSGVEGVVGKRKLGKRGGWGSGCWGGWGKISSNR